MAEDPRPLREQIEDLILWEASEAELAQAIFRYGEGGVEADVWNHLSLLYKSLEGMKAALFRLADEIEELKTGS